MSPSRKLKRLPTRIDPDQKRQLGNLAERVKGVSEFLTDAISATRPFSEAIQKSVPWADFLLGATGDFVPPVKFLIRLCETIGQVDDPEELGHIACTLAFQRSVAEILSAVTGPVTEANALKKVKEQLALLQPCRDVDFGSFTYETALEHEFFKRAELHLQTALLLIGYGKEEVHRITHLVKDRFVPCLKELLIRRETAQRFLPFKEYIQLGGGVARLAQRALVEHGKFQRWLFEDAPVLGRSPFALQQVYVETDCVYFSWGEINPKELQVRGGPIGDLLRRTRTREEVFAKQSPFKDPEAQTEAFDATNYAQRLNKQERQGSRVSNEPEFEKIDPFSESCGVRESLLKTVMSLIGNWRISEPIVIQGVAGAGKSSFTLRLCAELQRHHLRPILIRFKDLRFDRHVSDALPQAVRLSNDQRSPEFIPATPVDLFRGGEIFRESGTGDYSKISRYVLILDGWDEISIANEGFRHRIETILGQIRSEYISNPTLPVPVRIVMTGRPSVDLNESGFLRENTPILTIRPLTTEQLSKFFKKVATAVSERRLETSAEDKWAKFDAAKFRPFLRSYEVEFDGLSGLRAPLRPNSLETTSMGVLGLPLLALLAARLVSSWNQDPELLIQDSTALYRNLVNLTCKRGGKSETDSSVDDTPEQHRIAGSELRTLLWRTATAMTVYGQDIIPYEELSKRLELEGSELDEHVTRTTNRYSLTSLLISFYFKGGFRHTGCEFAHKSFREYLFAESLVEGLKNYGKIASNRLPERPSYWKDFGDDDPRFDLSQEFAKQLAPQWLRGEVIFHLDRLIEWEILRASGKMKRLEAGTPTQVCSLGGWRRIRDGLADLWDWWAEGVHLRPQPSLGKRRELTYKAPRVLELIEYSLPFDSNASHPRPTPTTTMDSHLGYGLLVLCVLVHHHLLAVETELGSSSSATKSNLEENSARRYQSLNPSGGSGLRFAPSGPNNEYFLGYIHRICSAGVRTTEAFPRQVDLRSVDLTSAYLKNMDFDGARFEKAVLNKATLSGASFNGANLKEVFMNGAKLDKTSFREARLDRARLYRTNFERANLDFAILDHALLEGAVLRGARLDHAILNHSNLQGVNFEEASLVGARLDGTRLDGAVLTRARLDHARLCGARLYAVKLDHASFRQARLIRATIEAASVNQTNFKDAILDRAFVRNTELSIANGLTEEQLAKLDAG